MKNNSSKAKNNQGFQQYCDASTNIFVNYIPPEFTKNELIKLCTPFGTILSAKVMINLKTGLSKCFGFVRFDHIESAKKAVKHLNGTILPGTKKRLLVRYAGSTMENIGKTTNSIFVKSICLFYTEKDIWALFSRFGHIEEIELIKSKKTNLFRGAAIITFSTIYDAQNAIREMNNVKLHEDSWPLFIQYTDQRANTRESNDGFVRYIDGVRIATSKSLKNTSTIKVNYASNELTQPKNGEVSNTNQNELKLTEEYRNLMFSLIAEEL